MKTWKCRCGAPLNFSCEDIATGRPAEGADFFCSMPDPARGPHNWGVVTYEQGQPALAGTAS